MTEKEVQLLGFEKEFLREGYDGEEGYYYALDLVEGLTFITPCEDDIKDNQWYVEIFNTDPCIRFYEFAYTQALLNTLTKAIVKPEKTNI